MSWARRGLYLAVSLPACLGNVEETLNTADLHLHVTGIDSMARVVEASVAPGDDSGPDRDLALIRRPSHDGASELDLYFLHLPATKYYIEVRAFGAGGLAQLQCARLPIPIVIQGAPVDHAISLSSISGTACGPDVMPGAEVGQDLGLARDGQTLEDVEGERPDYREMGPTGGRRDRPAERDRRENENENENGNEQDAQTED